MLKPSFARLLNLFITASILSVFLLTSCSQQNLLFEKNLPVNDSLRTGNNMITNYRIKPLDILQIKNLQSIKYIVDEAPVNGTGGGSGGAGASQGQTFQVADDGTVALPLVGHVPVAGLTRVEAAKLIEDLYRKNLLKDPIIDLKIINLKVTMLGEIKGQGNFPLVKDRTTLIDMIGEAGGLTEKADEKHIKIIRGNQKNPQVTEIDLSNIKSLTDPRIVLQNNDIIYVTKNKHANYVDRSQNVTALIAPALTVLSTALLIYTLIHR